MKKKKKVNTSGFERSKIGTIITRNGKKYMLSNKWQISYNKCPYCKSTKNFHKERMKTLEKSFKKTGKGYSNCIGAETRDGTNTHIFMKKNLCLKCGREWIIELFCWEKISGRDIEYFDFYTGKVYKKNILYWIKKLLKLI